jgi:hypothetical protein
MKSGSIVQKVFRLGILVAVACGATLATAQVENSGPQTIALNATLAESLTLGLSANAVNFTLTAGSATNAASANITATTAWILKPGRTAVRVYAYFSSAAAALTDGAGNNIPSSAFKIATGSLASTALTTATPFNAALAGLQLASVTITNANRSGNPST